jgi:hypothetical protein
MHTYIYNDSINICSGDGSDDVVMVSNSVMVVAATMMW